MAWSLLFCFPTTPAAATGSWVWDGHSAVFLSSKEQQYENGVVTTKAFSPTRSWLTSVESVKGGNTFQDLTYDHNPDGMIESIMSILAMESWQYTYDDLNRLTVATNVDTPGLSQSFQYDPIGNMTYNSHIGTYTYPVSGQARPHAVQTAGSRTYSYDNMGRMTSRDGTVIQWNGDGKPSSIGNAVFTYDGLGRRLKKLVDGETTLYPFEDYEISHYGTAMKYLAGGKQHGTLFGAFHRDHFGSIQSITTSSGEAIHKVYTPFGDTYSAIGWYQEEQKGWIGEREEETELVYLNARFYDPEIGRFISPDPIARSGQGLNRYSYSLNNPINILDPSGLDFCQAFENEQQCLDFLSNNSLQYRCEGNLDCDTISGSNFTVFVDSDLYMFLLMMSYGADDGETRAREILENKEYWKSNNIPAQGVPWCALDGSCPTEEKPVTPPSCTSCECNPALCGDPTPTTTPTTSSEDTSDTIPAKRGTSNGR